MAALVCCLILLVLFVVINILMLCLTIRIFPYISAALTHILRLKVVSLHDDDDDADDGNHGDRKS